MVKRQLISGLITADDLLFSNKNKNIMRNRKRDDYHMLEDLKRILTDLLNHEKEIRDSL